MILVSLLTCCRGQAEPTIPIQNDANYHTREDMVRHDIRRNIFVTRSYTRLCRAGSQLCTRPDFLRSEQRIYWIPFSPLSLRMWKATMGAAGICIYTVSPCLFLTLRGSMSLKCLECMKSEQICSTTIRDTMRKDKKVGMQNSAFRVVRWCSENGQWSMIPRIN